jgi:hypothetical protein
MAEKGQTHNIGDEVQKNASLGYINQSLNAEWRHNRRLL